MPTVQQLPAAVAVNLTDEVMLGQNGTSVAATVGQVLAAQPLGAGLLFSGVTLDADLTVLAPLANPALTGTPTAPTPPAGDDSTRIATTAFVLANAGGSGGGGTLTFTGDVSGAGSGTIDVTLVPVATPGTYEKVTIDATGRVLAGSALGTADITAAIAGADVSAADVTASGAGTARTLAARAADRINVLDFGADPTGVADSSAAFTAAMATVKAGEWGLLWVPRGTYLLASFLNQPPNTSIRVLFDDGASITGAGGLGVDCVEAHAGAFRYRGISGGFFPSSFQPAFESTADPGFVADYISNTPQNSRALRIGWDHRYTNTNLYGKVHNGIDLAQQRIHSWPNLYDNSSGWALWEVVQGATLDENSMATAGLAASAEVSETDVVNNSFEAGWTWHSGIGNPVQGKAIDPWGNVANGNYGGNILFAWGSVGSYDGSVGGLNFRWWCYPAVFSAGNPAAAAGTIVINGTTVNVTAGESVASIAAAINAAAIANVGAAANTWGGVVTRLVIYDTTANDAGTLTISGTALASLGITAGSFTTPRGQYAMVMGGSGTVAVGAQFVVNGATVTVGGAGAMADVAAAINASAPQGILGDVNAVGQIVITCYMPQQTGGLVLANVAGQTTLATLRLNAGTYLPPTPPKAFATASGDQTSPVCLTTDQIAISFTTAAGTSYGPLTVTLNGGAGTGWPADVAASISAALSTAGYLASSFTAPGSGTAIVAVRSTNAGGQQGVQIRNTGGGTLTLADAHGTPLETLGIAPGTWQPGGYSAGSQTVFMAAEDSIAAGGRGWFVGGASNATDLTAWPHAPGEVRGSFLHGLRCDYATFEDNNALVLGTGHALAWGRQQQGQSRLTVNAGTLEFNGAPLVNSAAFDAAFGAENGDVLVRAGGVWTALAPGSLGQYLAANGAGTPLAWLTPIPNAAAGTLLAASGTSGVAETITATAVLDAEFGAEVGDILVRTASGWAALTPGASGQSLMANGPGTALAWTTGVPTAAAGTLLAASGTAGVAETLTLGTNLSVTGGTLNAAGGTQEWTAGAVSLLGAGLTLSGGTLSASGGSGTVVRRAISGFQLTNDATTPATVLDIGAGQCADEAGAVWITTTATFYASIGGAWAAGAGTAAAPVNKMGTGLTAAAGTWYHVFAIINAGAADFYFDTSETAANAPSGTTAHRRVGSILTSGGSATIDGFQQVLTAGGAFTYWNAVATDYQGTATSTTTARQLITLSVPNGPTVRPLVRVASYNAQPFVLSSPLMPDVAPSGNTNPEQSPGWEAGGASSGGRAYGQIVTTTGQIGFRSAISGPTIGVFTFGYIDDRGAGA